MHANASSSNILSIILFYNIADSDGQREAGGDRDRPGQVPLRRLLQQVRTTKLFFPFEISSPIK